MPLADKHRGIWDAPAEMDLLEFFGAGPRDFRLTADTLTVAGESIPLAEAREIVCGVPIPQTPEQRRTVTIGDL